MLLSETNHQRPRASTPSARGLRLLETSTGLVLARLAIVGGLTAIAELIARLQLLPATFMAAPSRVVQRFAQFISDGSFIKAIGETLTALVVALAAASFLGFVAGYLLWRFRLLGKALIPFVNALFSSPVVLLYPVTLVLFGRNQTAVVVQAVAYAWLPVVVYTERAFSEVPLVLHRVSEVNCLSHWERLRHVMIPAAAPKLATGLRLGVTYTMISVISVEFLVQIGGLGQAIQLRALRFDMPGVYAYVITVVLLAAMAISLLHALERRVQR